LAFFSKNNIDGKAQSLNERTNAHEKEQDRGPRTASRI